MWHSLLTLVALGSQALSLASPAFVVCRDRYGRLSLEFVGQPCSHCHHDPVPPAGCEHHHEDAPSSATAPACECDHRPLADGTSRPCVLTGRVAVDVPDAAADWLTATVRPVPALARSACHHDPPGSGRSTHFLLLVAALRC